MFFSGVVGTIPAAGPSSPALFSTTAASIAATTPIEINFGKAFLKVGLVRMKVKHVAGGAATFTPRIFSKSGVTTSGDISMEYEGAATLIANLFDPQISDAPVVMQADSSGKLYFIPGPNAGANNQFTYAFRFLVYG